jgi:hypothetical protein
VSAYSEQTLAELIALLPPAPRAWVAAAQQIGPARRSLDTIVQRAREDVEFRRRVLADLEAAFRAEGIEPDRFAVELLKQRVSEL